MADSTVKQMDQHVESGSDKDAYELGGKEEQGVTDHTAGTFTYGIDAAHQKKVIRKIDLRMLPILGMMYSISLVDRTNLGKTPHTCHLRLE
jgi:hypothetical protein